MRQEENYNKEQIYVTFYPKVFQYLSHRTGNPQDAEDLAQTVFVKVYSKLDSFDQSKSSLSTWIFHITRNTLIDHQRSSTLHLHTELPENLEDGSEDMLEGLVLEEEQSRLADALERLTVEERDLILLHYYEEYTLLKISELMRRPYGQIKRLHAKALQKLGQYMGV